MSETFWTEVVRQLPLLLTAATAGYGVWVSKQNGKKADDIHAVASQAVTNTNGNLDTILAELTKVREDRARADRLNESLQVTVNTLSTILAAQRASGSNTPFAVRKSDPMPALQPTDKEKKEE